MGRPEIPRSIERLQFAETRLWGIAIAFFGVGDVVTTSLGLRLDGVSEAGVVTSILLEQYGLVSMLAVKIAMFTVFYFVWLSTPRPHRAGVPLGLAVLGVIVVWWNLFVNVAAIHL